MSEIQKNLLTGFGCDTYRITMPPAAARIIHKLQEAGYVLAAGLASADYVFTYCVTQTQLEDIFLGTGGEPLHSPKFDFDESVLDTGLALFRSLL